ncbi:MAG TPA: hypothetical protein VHT29_01930 [Solirubrobacteraceae bacterium]|jgi:hypothetical protein|nr:hypothetical protein [Solirubrobacteraceae bacterium]
MRGRIWIGLATAIVLVAVIVTFSGGSGGGGLNPVAQAAEATTQTDGAHVALSGSVSISGFATPITITGQGAFSFKANEGELEMSMAGFPSSVTARLSGSDLEMHEIYKAGSLYIGSSLLAGSLPTGAKWMRLDIAQVQQAIGLDPSSLMSGGTDPTALLRYLKASGGSRLVSHELVRGVPTAHYTGTIDLLKAAESQPSSDPAKLRAAFSKLIAQSGLRNLPVSVWIDSHGLVRKMSLTMSAGLGAQRSDVALSIEYFDFGATPSIVAPPASEVFDATGQTLQSITPGG